MTMPHLSNCPHSEDGWCLACVKKLHDELEEAENMISEIADVFGIGSSARDASTILTNAKNAARRSRCLGMIEGVHVRLEHDDDGEMCEESLLRWGDDPDAYIARYLAVIGRQNDDFEGMNTARIRQSLPKEYLEAIVTATEQEECSCCGQIGGHLIGCPERPPV